MEIEREVGDEGMNGFPTASTTWTALHRQADGKWTSCQPSIFCWNFGRKKRKKERKCVRSCQRWAPAAGRSQLGDWHGAVHTWNGTDGCRCRVAVARRRRGGLVAHCACGAQLHDWSPRRRRLVHSLATVMPGPRHMHARMLYGGESAHTGLLAESSRRRCQFTGDLAARQAIHQDGRTHCSLLPPQRSFF